MVQISIINRGNVSGRNNIVSAHGLYAGI